MHADHRQSNALYAWIMDRAELSTAHNAETWVVPLPAESKELFSLVPQALHVGRMAHDMHACTGPRTCTHTRPLPPATKNNPTPSTTCCGYCPHIRGSDDVCIHALLKMYCSQCTANNVFHFECIHLFYLWLVADVGDHHACCHVGDLDAAGGQGRGGYVHKKACLHV